MRVRLVGCIERMLQAEMLITEVKRKAKFEKSARLNAPIKGMCKDLLKVGRLGAGAGFEPATFRL